MRELLHDGELWIFGYGSLVWNPEFPHVETQPATLDGWRRSFCMRSIHHRGTVADPGLVLALDEDAGALCRGIAFRVDPDAHTDTMAALRERELVSSAYLERSLPLALDDGRSLRAVTYVIDPAHEQYCHLDLEVQAGIIARAVGGRGPNTDYLFNTAAHLEALGIEDAELSWLSRVVRAMQPS